MLIKRLSFQFHGNIKLEFQSKFVFREDSDPCYIQNEEEVKLRSFSTMVRSLLYIDHSLISLICKIHNVDLRVRYKMSEDGI